MNKVLWLSAAAAAVVAPACTTPIAGGPEPKVPAALAAPTGQSLSSVALASGVQIYVCGASANAARMEWAFRAPEAALTDRAGAVIGKHYAGPTWEAADGSRVVGEVRARDDGPDANAIPWLLLGARSNAGSGVYGAVKSIQRVDTRGGKAPAAACTAAQAGQEVRVPYTATYYFYA